MATVQVITLRDSNGNKQPIPKYDNETVYAFFDDGKSGYGRRYIAMVQSVVPFNVVKQTNKKLYRTWEKEVKGCYDLYAQNTDYFVSCTVFGYSDSPIWFVRTIDGGWFSFDYDECWQSGELDVSGKHCTELGLPQVNDWVAGVHYPPRN